eukprot:6336870-Pyramimonas_sp.AAC.1
MITSGLLASHQSASSGSFVHAPCQDSLGRAPGVGATAQAAQVRGLELIGWPWAWRRALDPDHTRARGLCPATAT